jgi:hypothetical protein
VGNVGLWEMVDKYYIEIRDRNGGLITRLDRKGKDSGWDGRGLLYSDILPSGEYMYYLNVLYRDCEYFERNGVFFIIRK